MEEIAETNLSKYRSIICDIPFTENTALTNKYNEYGDESRI